MKLAAYAQIRNECDIAHLFARHLGALYDHVLLIDHGSSDGTSAILANACRAYAGWECWRCDIAGHHQVAFAQFAIRHLFETTDAHIVLTHDADEFLAVADRGELEWHLGALDHPRAVGRLKWLNCVPERFETVEGCGIETGFWRAEAKSRFGKMAVSRAFMVSTAGRAVPTMGNHWIETNDDGGMDVREIAALLHFPVRSASQISQKAITGSISDALRADREADDNVHWRSIVGQVAAGTLDEEDLVGLAAHYGEPDAAQSRHPFSDLPRLGFSLQRSGPVLAADFPTVATQRPDPLQAIASTLLSANRVRADSLELFIDNAHLLDRRSSGGDLEHASKPHSHRAERLAILAAGA